MFVFLDNVQYKKREFQNRNKIRTKDGGIWLTVPVVTKGKFEQKISEVEIDNTESWAKSHYKSICMAYSKTKYFSEHNVFFEEVYSRDWNRLCDLNLKIIFYLLKNFKIDIPIYYESKLDIDGTKTDRIIKICKKLNADTYLSGIGARDYLDEEALKNNKLQLVYQNFTYPEYPQAYDGFEPYMSAIDLLFNCGPESYKYIL